MAILKCKMCGGTLNIEQNQSVAVCEYCGTKQTLPKVDSEQLAALYERAELLRSSSDFDKAASVYEQIVSASPMDAEAYWSLVLCRYGIEYVEDPASHKRIPTVNRIQYGSVLDDADYLSALQHADTLQKSIYEAEARAIEAIQKGFLAISMKEKAFDVFICYKETDNNGRRTPDSVLANDLYHQLTQEGFKVFFSRITLEDKLGTEYEPYIFAALNSAKVMVVLGTKPEYFNAVWVRNEWSRFHALIKNGEQKTLIPAYRDMNPYDLPEEFSHLQAQDMSKLGFMQDLTRGIKKILGANAPSGQFTQLLKRAFLALEDGEWKKADAFCEQVLNEDAEHAAAYLVKTMAELHVSKQEDLQKHSAALRKNVNFQRAIRYGGSELKEELEGYLTAAADPEKKKKQQKLLKTLGISVAAIAVVIGCVLGGKTVKANLDEKAALEAQLAAEEAARARYAADYEAAVALKESGDLKAAMEAFAQMADYEDSAELAKVCHAELLWQDFRAAMDAETPDHETASAVLAELTELDSQKADEGWHELTKIYYKKGLPKEAGEYLSKISNLSSFEDGETLQEDIRLLDIYVQAKEIKVTSEETKTALQELLDQLPDDYRKVADLRRQITDYELAVEAQIKQEASVEPVIPTDTVKKVELPLTPQNLAGTWKFRASDGGNGGLELTFGADYSFKIRAIQYAGQGTYSINGNNVHMEFRYTESSAIYANVGERTYLDRTITCLYEDGFSCNESKSIDYDRIY